MAAPHAQLFEPVGAYQQSNTVGAGPFTLLAGAVTGYRTFEDAGALGKSFRYTARKRDGAWTETPVEQTA